MNFFAKQFFNRCRIVNRGMMIITIIILCIYHQTSVHYSATIEKLFSKKILYFLPANSENVSNFFAPKIMGLCSSLGPYRGDTCSRSLYKRRAPMHVTKTVWFNWSAVFESFWYMKLHGIELRSLQCKFLVQVSSGCHPYKA